MSEQVFVARDQELRLLEGFLDRALGGEGQVVFVAGEAGSGKTTLILEFLRRAQHRQPDLVAAMGNCNAQIGVGDAYLPWREILLTLTSDVQEARSKEPVHVENSQRLRQILAHSGMFVLLVAPDLAGVFLPGGKVISTVSKALAKQLGLEDRLKSQTKVKSAQTDLAQPTLAQDQIFEQYANFLAKVSGEAPLVLIVDDLQWADESSIALFFHLARRIAKHRILLVGTYRPEEVAMGRDGARHPLEKVIAEVRRYQGDAIVELEIGDLTAARHFVDDYLDSQPNRLGYEFRQKLAELTRGHPLFVTELLLTMQARGELVKDEQDRWIECASFRWDRLPARIDGVLQERVDRLPAEDRESLITASVQGQHFLAEVVAQLQKVSPRELVSRLSGELSREQRLVLAEGMERIGERRLSAYVFRHHLIQSYLQGRLDVAELAYLHEDIGNALEEIYAAQADDIAVQLAWHFSEAGVTGKAVHYLRRAGELAAARYANAEAEQHFTRALELAPPQDLNTRFELLLAREAVYGWQGNREAQERDLTALAALAQAQGTPSNRAEVNLRQAEYARLKRDYARALEQAQAAVAQAGKAGTPAQEAQGYALWGRILLNKGEYVEAREWLELGLDLARATQLRVLEARISYDLAMTDYYRDRFPEAQQGFEMAQHLHQGTVNRMGEINTLMMLGVLQGAQGNVAASLPYLDQALEQCRSTGWRYGQTIALGNLGNAYLDLGIYDKAQAYHQQALEVCQALGDREGEAASLDTLGLISYHRGQPEQAQEYFAQALAIQRSIGYRRGEGYTLTHQGHSLADSSQLSQAREAFQQALSIRRQMDPNNGAAVDDLAGLARVAWAEGNLPEAHNYASQALDWMEQNGTDRVEYPVQAYAICYQVLAAMSAQHPADQARARAALEAGILLLGQRAARIQDEALRRAFLNNIPFNRELLASWQAAHPGQSWPLNP